MTNSHKINATTCKTAEVGHKLATNKDPSREQRLHCFSRWPVSLERNIEIDHLFHLTSRNVLPIPFVELVWFLSSVDEIKEFICDSSLAAT
jgi:hypothetical protein